MAVQDANLWITYVSEGDEPGDFTFLVDEIADDGILAFFDRIPIKPGGDLWEKLAEPMGEPSLDGWAVVLTPSNMGSAVVREELAHGLDRVMNTRGGAFPVVLLLHGLRADRIPPALRAPGCVSLADPEWRDKLAEALHVEPATRRATRGARRRPRESTALPPTYTMTIHRAVGDKSQQTALEFRPESGELPHWCFGIPVSCDSLTGWGRWKSGGIPSRAALMDPDRNDVIMGIRRRIEGTNYVFRGAGDPLSAEHSAYALFYGAVPKTVVFAHGDHPDGPPILDEQVFTIELGD